MNGTLRALTIFLIVIAVVVAFLAGAATVTGHAPAAPQALTLAQWAAVQASNSLLLDQGPLSTYLPIVLRH
jgi:hypothetical protein